MTPATTLTPRGNRALSTSASHHPFAPAQVAIVGGGLAGLAAATRLAELSVHSSVFDMGTRVLGGRSCSRVLSEESGGLAFDHGAQFIAPTSEEFTEEVQRWVKAGVAAPWQGRFGALDPRTFVFTSSDELSGSNKVMGAGFCGLFGHLGGKSELEKGNQSVFVGTPTMGSISQFLASEAKAQGSSIKLGHKVTGLYWNAEQRLWNVEGVPRPAAAATTPASFGSFEAVIIADALVALPGSAGYATGLLEGPTEIRNIIENIQKVQHVPVFTLMVGLESPVDLEAVPFDAVSIENLGAESSVASGFQWIARNSSKPGRIDPDQEESRAKIETWVAITTPQKARELLERWPLHTTKGAYNPQDSKYRDGVAKELLGDFLETLEQAGSAHISSAKKGIPKLPEVVYCHAQRWGRGFVDVPLDQGFLGAPEARFAACGDFCVSTRLAGTTYTPLETAWRSGRQAADAVVAWLGKEAQG